MDFHGKEVGDTDEIAVHAHPGPGGVGGHRDIADELLLLILEEVDDLGRQGFRVQRVARVVQEQVAEVVARPLELAGVEERPRPQLQGLML